MNIPVKYTCPLGSQCERIVDGTLERCAWYVQLAGKDPQSEKQLDEWRCAIAWQPILSVEMSQTNRGQTAALESFRNETVRRQDRVLKMAVQNAGQPKAINTAETVLLEGNARKD